VDRDKLRKEVTDMRVRMRDELSRETAEIFDLKQGRGGIADIEFTVQYLVLAGAAEHPDLIFYSDNIRQLEALAKAGILDAEEAETLAEAYRAYRRRIHRLSLAGHDPLVPRVEVDELPDVVVAAWERAFS
jgi:glutamate-ammonia-ligase adenylyltransferase